MIKMTNYLQIEKLLKHPFRNALIIYIIYLLVVSIQHFFFYPTVTVIPGAPIPPNWTDIKWISIWSFTYFLSFYIFISFMRDEQEIGNYNYIYKDKNLIVELFRQSFRSEIPIISGLLLSLLYLLFSKIILGSIVPYLDDSVIIFLIIIVFNIFFYMIKYMSKIGEVMLKSFEKYDNSANITNLFNITKRNEILSFGSLISKSILSLSILSALLILFAFLDIYRYSHNFIGYLLLAALVILPPYIFYISIQKNHRE